MFKFSSGDIVKIIPEKWKTDGHSHVIYSGYHCLSPKSQSLEKGWFVHLDNAIVLAIWGDIEYTENLQKPKLDYDANGNLNFTPVGKIDAVINNQANIIIVQRVYSEEDFNSQHYEDERNAICSLLSVCFNTGITYSKIFVNAIDTKNKQTVAFVGNLSVKSTFLFQPFFSQERADQVALIFNSILNKGQAKYKYLIALNWYDTSHRSANSLDAFIYIWIGIEALVMKESSNISSLKKSMADAYGMTPKDANNFFGLGRILNARSTLFHGQNRPSVQILFVEYLEAVFVDVLHQELSLKCEERAKTFLAGKDFNQSGLMPA